MNVLLATPYRLDPQLGGPAHTVVSTGLKLAEYGVETSFLTGDRRRFPPPGRIASFREIPRVDLVHNFGIWVAFSQVVSIAAQLFRVPRVVAPIGQLEPWALGQRAQKKRLAMALYQRRDLESAAVIHATAPSEADSLRALRLKTPIAIIPHGMDVPDESAIAEPVDPTDGIRTMLFLSRIHPKKGLLELVEAWGELRPTNWRVVVAGPDENGHRAEVEAAVRCHRVQESFEFTGQVTPQEKHRLLRTAELLVLPTHSENFGLVVPEALSYGVPVLTTRGTPWSELEQTNSGWWIETGSQALSAALQNILPMSKEQLRAMGRNGRKLIIDRYSWASVAERHIELYRWIAGNSPKPSFVLD